MNNELKEILQSVLKDALEPINQRFDKMENRFGNLENELKEIKSEQGSMKNDLKEIKSDVTAIKMRQDGLREDISAIRYNQDATNATLKSLAEDVNYIKCDVTKLNEGQARQEKILERLALRSIEQETEILELKRIK